MVLRGYGIHLLKTSKEIFDIAKWCFEGLCFRLLIAFGAVLLSC